jgi:hypothetical protein
MVPLLERFSRGELPLHSSSAAIRRSKCEPFGLFGPWMLGEDTEYWTRLSLAVGVAVSSRVTAMYRRSPGGLIGQSATRWTTLQSARDLSPVIGLLLDQWTQLPSAAHRAAVDRLIDTYSGWAVRRCAEIGDVRTARVLRKVYRGTPPAFEQLLIQTARLPGPLARAAFSILRAAMRLRNGRHRAG